MADKLLKSIKFPTLPDRYVIGDASLTEEGAAADAKAVGEALATKADTKGMYEDLIVGGAEQLMADGYETDKEPYLFRTTGGSADVGNREYLDKIVGGTVAWNQLQQKLTAPNGSVSGVTATIDSDGYLVLSGTATEDGQLKPLPQRGSVPANNVLLYMADGTPDYMWGRGGFGFTNTGKYFIHKYSVAFSAVVYIQLESGHSYNSKTRFNIIDLTAMFGSTIADYIYSLEQSQAGAGVAWFRNYFPKDYYPYDPGTLRSVEGVSAHETVGFNQYNPATGTARLLGGHQYQITGTYTAISLDGTAITPDSDGLFTPTSNGVLTVTGGNSTDTCVHLVWSGTRNGEYEPYTKHTYPLDSSLTLRGVPKLVDGKLAFDGDIYPPGGDVQRRYGIVDLGTLDWIKGGTQWYTSGLSNVIKRPSTTEKPNLIISNGNYIPVSMNNDSGVQGSYEITVNSSSNINWRVPLDAYTDATAFKAAMSGVYLVYELATPTTETAEGYEQYQRCDPSGTEEFVTDSIVPVGHETRYPHDLKKKIETAPDSPSTDGTYLMKRSGGKNTYMALPSTPSANGAYVLTVTVSGGSASYSWTAKE